MNKKLRLIAGTTLMLAAGVIFGNGYTSFGSPSRSVVVYASTLTSDGNLWEFSTYGEIYNYIGNQKEITIPDTLTCNGVTYPVTEINHNAIRKNDTVEVVHFSSNIHYCGFDYFKQCSNLRKITVPDSNPDFLVREEALYIKDENGDPNRLIAIPAKANIESLNIPDTVFDYSIFSIADNDTIKEVYIGKGLENTNFASVLGGFSALEQIEVSSENEELLSEDGILYDKDKTSLLVYPCKKTESSYTFPQSVTSMGGSAFAHETPTLKNINFTNYLGKESNNSCYFGNLQLTSINGCTTIEEYEALSAQTRDYIARLLKKMENQPIIIKLCNEAVDRAIAQNVTEKMTSYQKIKALHDYVCKKVHYAPNKKKLQNDQYHCIPSIFLTDETVCEGYALGFSLILDRLGFESHVIHAYEHAWNLVKLNDIWVAIDVCWDDETSGWNYNYFLVTYDEMQSRFTSIDKSHVAESVYGTSRYKGYGLEHMPTDDILPDYNPIIGDITMDGKIDAYDLQCMSNELRGYTIITLEGGAYYNLRADLDRDGDIDVDDYNALDAMINANS